MTVENGISARRAELSAEKRTLLEKRLRGAPESGPRAQRIPGRVDRGNAPLSFAQQRLWFLDQLEPDSPLYNLPTAIRIGGRLDRAVLAKGINAVVARHESLRTRFIAEEGNPVQVVAAALEVETPFVDLGRLAAAEREAALPRVLETEARRAFDLSREPLVRVLLVRLGDAEHVLMVNMHHVVSDAWSLSVFFRELAALYEALREGREAALPELPIQYPDYAAWQREWMQGAVMEEQLAYWKQHLNGAPYLLELPADKPRPARQSFSGGRATSCAKKPVCCDPVT